MAAAALGLLLFLAALFAAVKYLPGPVVLGREEPDGTRFPYRINGLAIFAAANVAVAAGTLIFDLSLAPLIHHFWALFAAANAVSFALAFWLHRARARRGGTDHAPAETDRTRAEPPRLRRRSQDVGLRAVADRPRSAGRRVRLRAVRAPRPDHAADGLLADRLVGLPGDPLRPAGLPALDLRRDRGAVRADAAVGRPGAGPLLLLDRRLDAARPARADGNPGAARDLAALYGVSLWMFRSANAQKWRFKQDPKTVIWGEKAEAIGGRLLISGWWGIGRHLNYTGEIGVYLALTLATGFHSFVPYLLPLWMLVLLVHRACRDDRRCRAKYGALWHAYCAHTHFRMFPFLY